MPRKPVPVALDSEQIQTLASWGCTDEDIAKLARISERTLQKRFRNELDIGRVMLRNKIRAAQIKCAIEKLNVAMLIWLGKQYLKQRDVAPLRVDDDELEQRFKTIIVELTDAFTTKNIAAIESNTN